MISVTIDVVYIVFGCFFAFIIVGYMAYSKLLNELKEARWELEDEEKRYTDIIREKDLYYKNLAEGKEALKIEEVMTFIERDMKALFYLQKQELMNAFEALRDVTETAKKQKTKSDFRKAMDEDKLVRAYDE